MQLTTRQVVSTQVYTDVDPEELRAKAQRDDEPPAVERARAAAECVTNGASWEDVRALLPDEAPRRLILCDGRD